MEQRLGESETKHCWIRVLFIEETLITKKGLQISLQEFDSQTLVPFSGQSVCDLEDFGVVDWGPKDI